MTTLKVTDRDGRSHTLEAYKGSSVMESLRDEDMGIEAICGGQCACATCHCLLDEAWFEKLTPPGEDETESLESLDHYEAGRSRLTCQIIVSSQHEALELTIGPEE
ncbi:MAG: 2Fe-2S iron-sulfur cluster binding domain-containing protein [Gammaproteobacteria bacterium]|nr:2Fe-2S iron-sulfur cluster binding domain-containing protein [Gammaproteobacteria bacterium]